MDAPAKTGRADQTNKKRKIPVKALPQLKKPFGTARMVDIIHVRYLAWEDAFDVEFEDGLSFLEPHETIRRANHVSARAKVTEVILDDTGGGFEVRYDTGEVGEVSWSFVRELPPRKRASPRMPADRGGLT
jgi:hypothetical protein